MAKDPTRVIIKRARSTYMFCTELREGKVKTGIFWPDSDKKTTNALLEAIGEAALKKHNKKGYTRPGIKGCPLRHIGEQREDGTLPPSLEELPDDVYYLTASAYKLPGLMVDGEAVDVMDQETREEYLVSGNYFSFSIKFKGYYNKEENAKGVRAELCNIKFLEEGERLDGGVKAEDEDWGEEEETPRSSRSSRSSRNDEESPTRRSRRSRQSANFQDDDDDIPF